MHRIGRIGVSYATGNKVICTFPFGLSNITYIFSKPKSYEKHNWIHCTLWFFTSQYFTSILQDILLLPVILTRSQHYSSIVMIFGRMTRTEGTCKDTKNQVNAMKTYSGKVIWENRILFTLLEENYPFHNDYIRIYFSSRLNSKYR